MKRYILCFSIFILLFPLVAYEVTIYSFKSLPDKPTPELMTKYKRDYVAKLIGKSGYLHKLDPYSYIFYMFKLKTYKPVYDAVNDMPDGTYVAFDIARDHLIRQGSGYWYFTSQVLTIWVTRNFTYDEIIEKYAEINEVNDFYIDYKKLRRQRYQETLR